MKINIKKLLIFKILTFVVFSQQFLLGMQVTPSCSKKTFVQRLLTYPSIKLNNRQKQALNYVIYLQVNINNQSNNAPASKNATVGEKQLRDKFPILAQSLFNTTPNFNITPNDIEPYFWPYLYLKELKFTNQKNLFNHTIQSISSALEVANTLESKNVNFVNKILEIAENDVNKIEKFKKAFFQSAPSKYKKLNTYFYPTEDAELINRFTSVLNFNGSNNTTLVNEKHITGIERSNGNLQGGHFFKNTQNKCMQTLTKKEYCSIKFDAQSLIENKHSIQPCLGKWNAKKITLLNNQTKNKENLLPKIASIFPKVWEKENIFAAIRNIYRRYKRNEAFTNEQQAGIVDVIGDYYGIKILINIIKNYPNFSNIDTINTAYPVFIYDYDVLSPQLFLNPLNQDQKTFMKDWFNMICNTYNITNSTDIANLTDFQRPKVFTSQQNNQNTISLFYILGINLNLINYNGNIHDYKDIGRDFLKMLWQAFTI